MLFVSLSRSYPPTHPRNPFITLPHESSFHISCIGVLLYRPFFLGSLLSLFLVHFLASVLCSSFNPLYLTSSYTGGPGSKCRLPCSFSSLYSILLKSPTLFTTNHMLSSFIRYPLAVAIIYSACLERSIGPCESMSRITMCERWTCSDVQALMFFSSLLPD